MKTRGIIGTIAALVVLFASPPFGGNGRGAASAQDQAPPAPGQEQIEVLTRGPVHEAFAEPVDLQVQAGLIIPNQPPANIVEVPPADRPQGEQFSWVPGYWSWDTDRNDFIWVSACWRVGPPNTYWVPGYWAPVATAQEVRQGGVHVSVGGVNVNVGGHSAPAATAGWEWVSGFWAADDAKEIQYLPAPPPTEDIQPIGIAPSANHMWVPGCWYWQSEQYVRRPGYWLEQQSGWVWAPSHYRWTPRGYVLAAGHWDYSLERRGMLFAPVYFSRSTYSRAGFSYSPTVAIDIGVLSVNLFTYPRYGHYYFGDYYDDAYLTMGIYPQFEMERRHTWYDPIYSYDRWHYGRTDRQWESHRREAYDSRRSNRDLRPARTYREMERRVAKMPEAQRRDFELARTAQAIAASKSSTLRYERINADAQKKISQQAAESHRFRDERAKWEAAEDRKEAAADRKEATADRKEAAARREAAGRKEAAERKEAAADRKEAARPPDRKGPVSAMPRDTGDTVAPRRVHVDKPERVKIPVQPPIVGRRGAPDADKAPPTRPDNERKLKADAKADAKAEAKADAKAEAKADAKADAKERDKDKDTDKDKSKDKGKGK